jgi:hypothetical protein
MLVLKNAIAVVVRPRGVGQTGAIVIHGCERGEPTRITKASFDIADPVELAFLVPLLNNDGVWSARPGFPHHPADREFPRCIDPP